ncbi:hypothetical protein GCM10010116_00120 [Microbispora rosea subsp. aerata]|nr:hypothetical protein [Microbispora rosea]GGO00116.1 hypothetical protein GCM10010116_00120 [Microbispora rosea subsp. aerata]GIH56766.1 hypothetical protein Mro02_36800 [Microbispora rosea subsp. aerata]GLJ84250.1 hypothetical protein GCM10017588_29780 [Microbispora rosea subsp. aerata]
MIAARSARRALALGAALVTTGVLSLALTPTPAMAAGVTLHATVDCLNYNSFGNTSDWYPIAPAVGASPYGGGGTVPYSSMVAVPANHAWQFTRTLPSGTTTVSVSAKCSEGHTYDLTGSAGGVSIPAGTTTVTATWGCTTAPVSPGPWVTNCSVLSVSYS